ncbi:MAG TPA: hypothetical protein VFU21_14625 [Kofleriaceae bacterium]|nr:hypothetical protein [Kofleriaceae bacterium]
MMARLVAAAIAAVLFAAPRVAGAEQPVLVLQFSGEPAPSAAALSKRMAEAVRASGREVTEASREDVFTLAGCAEASDECLRQALGTLEAREVVTGEVRAAGSGVEVELRAVARDGEPRARTVAVPGATPTEQVAAFGPEADAFWNGQPSPAEAAAAAEPAQPPPGADLSRPDDGGRAGFSASRVEPWAWGIAGGGAGLMAVGAVLLLAAEGKQSDVDDAPTDTVSDLEALVELEESGRRYARWGNVCILVGGIAAIAGGVLVYRQGTRAEEEAASPQITLTPSPGDGVGAALVVRGGF